MMSTYGLIVMLNVKCYIKVTPNEAPKVYADTAVIAPKNPDEKGCPRYSHLSLSVCTYYIVLNWLVRFRDEGRERPFNELRM